jgi:hypothetical protein
MAEPRSPSRTSSPRRPIRAGTIVTGRTPEEERRYREWLRPGTEVDLDQPLDVRAEPELPPDPPEPTFVRLANAKTGGGVRTTASEARAGHKRQDESYARKLLISPVTGGTRAFEGARTLGVVLHGIDDPADPRPRLRRAAGGAADLLGGTMEAATPFVPGALIKAPLQVGVGLLAGSLAGSGVHAAGEHLGVPKEYTDLAAEAAGLGTGIAAHHVAGSPAARTAIASEGRRFYADESGELKLPDIGTPPPKLAGEVTPEQARHLEVAPVERVNGRLIVSTRVPKGKKIGPAPDNVPLVTGVEDAAQDPTLLGKMAEKVRGYPLLKPREARMNDRGVVDAAVDRFTENLDALIGMQPRATREASAEWYPGAHGIANEAAAEVGVTGDQGAGLVATQSPGKPWPQNINLAQRMARLWKEFQDTDPLFTAEHFTRFADTIRQSAESWIVDNKLTGAAAAKARARAAAKTAETRSYIDRPWSELPVRQQAHMVRAHSELTDPAQQYPIYAPDGTITSPVAMNADGTPSRLVWQSYLNIENGLSILHDGSDANISMRVGDGHKVRSFFNNINVPSDPRSVTIDTHHVGGSHFRPMGGSAREVLDVMGGPASAPTGISGLHPLYRDAATRAAGANRLLPNQGQSVAWESIKGLFSPSQRRNPRFVAEVRSMWEAHARGRMSLEELHGRIYDLAGGLTPPEWAPGKQGRAPGGAD